MREASKLLLVALALALWACPTLAQAQSAETMLHEAIQRYKVGKFSQSAKILKRALRKAKDPLVQGKIQLYTGLNHGVQGEMGKAEAAFKKALALDPTLELKATETKQSIMEAFGRARQAVKGRLSVSADKPGATLTVDGKQLGALPYEGELVVGKHSVSVTTADGRFGHRGEVLVRAGQTHSMQLMLRPLLGKLTVSSSPAGALVLVDGVKRGKTPLGGLDLPPGPHTVKLSLKGYRTREERVELKAGEQAAVEVKLAVLPVKVARPKPAPPPPTKSKGRLWTWVAAGSAAAAAGVGLGLGLWSAKGWSQYQEAADAGDTKRYNELRDSIPGRTLGTNIAFGVAGALAVTAVVLFFVEAPGERPTTGPQVSRDPGYLLSYEF